MPALIPPLALSLTSNPFCATSRTIVTVPIFTRTYQPTLDHSMYAKAFYFINLNAAILRLLPIVKYGGPIMADENVYAAVEAGEVMVDIIRGIAISFNTTFWKKVLG